MRLFRKFAAIMLLCTAMTAAVNPLYAQTSSGRFSQGLYNTTTAALQLPFQMVNSTLTKPFPFGVVDGVVRGTFSSVSQMVGGIFDMGVGAAPYAKYAVFFV